MCGCGLRLFSPLAFNLPASETGGKVHRWILPPKNFSKKGLANFYFGVETKCSLKQRGQMSGNPVRIRDGCATVTATNSKATGNGKAE